MPVKKITNVKSISQENKMGSFRIGGGVPGVLQSAIWKRDFRLGAEML